MAEEALPIDIIVAEILPRLPAKSLLRFKCVSKFFLTLILNPEFVHRQLCHSQSSDANRLLILIGKSGGLFSFHLDSPEFPAVSLRFPQSINESGLFVVGSCNGLACIGNRPLSSLFIFNPSTGIYRQIYCNHITLASSSINYGFGFDDVNNDYKVVRVTSHISYNFDNGGHVGMRRKVKVYSLKSDSWSLVERTSNQDSIKHMENGALVDNHLVHWKFWNALNGEHRIGCFNLRSDRWGDDVPLPEYYAEEHSNRGAHFADILFQTYRDKQSDLVHLGVLDGCLCLLTSKPQKTGVDVWVMKEYRVKESWVFLVHVSNGDVIQPLMISPFAYGRTSRSEILLRVDSLSRFFWYNIRDKTWRWAEICGVPRHSEACICKGSLVSIPGGLRFQIGASGNRAQQRLQA